VRQVFLNNHQIFKKSSRSQASPFVSKGIYHCQKGTRAMPVERKGLSGPVQMVLAVLVLLPLWYMAANRLSAGSSPEEITPYYMWCPDCGLEYLCGDKGLPGMVCLRCGDPKPTLVFRTRSDSPLSDLLVRCLVGVISFLAIVFLIVGGHRPKKVPEDPVRPKDPAAREAAANDMKNWARELIVNRRRRLEE
jgi:hypothetical protein